MGGIRTVEIDEDLQEFQREELEITGFGKKAERSVRIAISTLLLLEMKITIARVRGDSRHVWFERLPVSFLGLGPEIYCDGQQQELRCIPYGPQTRPP